MSALALCRSGPANGQPSAPAFAALKAPVVIPVSDVEDPWNPVEFTARCVAAANERRPATEKLLKGALLRLPGAEGKAGQVKAFCLTCPHEICQVSLTEQTEGVKLEGGELPKHPIFVCSCHFSAFDPLMEGARIAGPTHRGLYRFKIEVRGEQVVVNEVEQAALV